MIIYTDGSIIDKAKVKAGIAVVKRERQVPKS